MIWTGGAPASRPASTSTTSAGSFRGAKSWQDACGASSVRARWRSAGRRHSPIAGAPTAGRRSTATTWSASSARTPGDSRRRARDRANGVHRAVRRRRPRARRPSTSTRQTSLPRTSPISAEPPLMLVFPDPCVKPRQAVDGHRRPLASASNRLTRRVTWYIPAPDEHRARARRPCCTDLAPQAAMRIGRSAPATRRLNIH
jgi:hypothetical protein